MTLQEAQSYYAPTQSTYWLSVQGGWVDIPRQLFHLYLEICGYATTLVWSVAREEKAMSDVFEEGYKKGYADGGSGKDIDAYKLSQFYDEYRAGYVLGFGESEFVAAPAEYRYQLIGGIAAKSGVALSIFERYHDLNDEGWDGFKKGFTGDEHDEHFNEDDFDD